jgi:hypothetical protein
MKTTLIELTQEEKKSITGGVQEPWWRFMGQVVGTLKNIMQLPDGREQNFYHPGKM